MKASEFDDKFDQGESVLEALDLAGGHRPGEEQKRINVDSPLDDRGPRPRGAAHRRNAPIGDQNVAGAGIAGSQIVTVFLRELD